MKYNWYLMVIVSEYMSLFGSSLGSLMGSLMGGSSLKTNVLPSTKISIPSFFWAHFSIIVKNVFIVLIYLGNFITLLLLLFYFNFCDILLRISQK